MCDMEYPNWFEQTARENFEKFLTPLAGKDRLGFLQLGAFTGDASVWMAENILTGKYSILMDVDTWKGSAEEAHDAMDFDDVRKTYLDKVTPYKSIHSYIGTTVDFFSEHNYKEINDFIYIDADHTTVGVLVDAELGWRRLKSGGIMAFDDYTWGADSPPELTPTLGIDLFLARHEGKYEVLVINQQVWIKKK